MNKFNHHDLLRLLLAALLSVLAWIGLEIRAEQVNIANRLRLVELNQAKIMTVLGINPDPREPKTAEILSDYSR